MAIGQIFASESDVSQFNVLARVIPCRLPDTLAVRHFGSKTLRQHCRSVPKTHRQYCRSVRTLRQCSSAAEMSCCRSVLLPKCPYTANIAINDISLKTRFFSLHFRCRKYWCIFNQFYVICPKATEFGEITLPLRLLRRSRSSKVTEFCTNRKLICDILLMINTNLAPILHRFRDIAFDRSKVAIFGYPSGV